MKSDGYEIRVRSYATVCPMCIRMCFDGAVARTDSLLRDGFMHAMPIDSESALCSTLTAPQVRASAMSGEA
jgi:hypothetical protein